MDETFNDVCFIANLRSPYFKESFFFSKQRYKKATKYESIPVKAFNSFNRLNRTLIWGTFKTKNWLVYLSISIIEVQETRSSKERNNLQRKF